MISNLFFWLQVVAASLIIVLVVLQPSKGSDLGSIAGGDSSNGNKTFIDPMTKFTGLILILFLVFSFSVSWLKVHSAKTFEEPNKEVVTNYMTDNIKEKTGEE